MDRRFVDHLVNSDLITRAQMQREILRSKKNKVGLVEQLLESKNIGEDTIADAIAQCYGYPRLDVSNGFEAEPDAYNLLPPKLAKKHCVLPFQVEGSSVSILIYNSDSVDTVVATLKTATGSKPEVFVSDRTFVESAIAHYYDAADWPDKPPMPAKLDAQPKGSGIVVIDEPTPRSRSRARTRKVKYEGTHEPAIAKQEPRKPTPPPRPTPAPRKSKPTPKPAPKESSVQSALEDFDAFLDSPDFLSGSPALSADAVDVDSDVADPWAREESNGAFDLSGWEDIDEPEAPNASQAGFDLFEPSEVELTINDLVDRHERALNKLHQELKGQREVVSTLVDMLVEARILNRKELMRRVKSKRK